MPKVISKPVETAVELPEVLKPYTQLGLDIQLPRSGDEILMDCPFCGRDNKFSINVDSGLWRCLICGGNQDSTGGGIYAFMSELWKQSFDATDISSYKQLAANRGLQVDTLIQWGVAKSTLSGEWLLPGYGVDDKGQLVIRQLYSYRRVGDRMLLAPTSSGGHTLFGLQLYDKDKQDISVCEGPWDGMRLWEVMKGTKQTEDGFALTSSADHCLLSTMNVVATPTCSSFNQKWDRWFAGKNVFLWYDNDHPKKHPKTGAELQPAGWAGMRRDAGKLAEVANNIAYLHWGDGGYDPALPDGYDLKDLLKDNPAAQKTAFDGLRLMYERCEPIPEAWIKDSSPDQQIQPMACSNWRQLINVWRRALKWTDGLEHALAVMLASVASTKSIGDQLWIKVIGPPSCGKSTLCEALTVNKKYVIAKSTIRGFHSGYKGAGGGEDNSLIPLIMDKTLVTKDGDTLLQAPNLSQILSEARDIYDCVSRTHYRNSVSKEYEGVRMTWLLCGTSSLRTIDSSELGQRFLDCVIMEQIDAELEDEILWRVVNKAADHVDIEANGEASSQHSEELVIAMAYTGGYVGWLRDNANKLLSKIKFDEERKKRCVHIGKFVAYMRARPAREQKEKSERELAARLVSTHTRLAKCLALVLNRNEVDEEVMERVHRVGLDTSRGIVLDIAGTLFEAGEEGMESRGICHSVNYTDNETRKLLRFMRDIKIIDLVQFEKNRKAWVLTSRFRDLYKEVMCCE